MAKQKKTKNNKTIDSDKKAKASKRKKSTSHLNETTKAHHKSKLDISETHGAPDEYGPIVTEPTETLLGSSSPAKGSKQTVAETTKLPKGSNGTFIKNADPVKVSRQSMNQTAESAIVSKETSNKTAEPVETSQRSVAQTTEPAKGPKKTNMEAMKPARAPESSNIKAVKPTKALPVKSPGERISQQLQTDAYQAVENWFSLMNRFATSSITKMTQDAWDYWLDSSQRWLLFMDTLRQRGNNMIEHYRSGMPPLLER